MTEAVLSTMGWVVSNHLIAGWEPHRAGNDNIAASPSGVFQARDAVFNIAANKQEQFETLCRVVGRPELANDPRFATRKERIENRAALKDALEQALAPRDAADWVAKLMAAGVPSGEILTLPQALRLPQTETRDLVARFDTSGVDRDVQIVRPGFKLDGTRPKTDLPPPGLGDSTDKILSELGLTGQDIERLRSRGVV